ncbi:hypothetical protein DSECCO2_594160 [anaerobic digester metagenome]
MVSATGWAGNARDCQTGSVRRAQQRGRSCEGKAVTPAFALRRALTRRIARR